MLHIGAQRSSVLQAITGSAANAQTFLHALTRRRSNGGRVLHKVLRCRRQALRLLPELLHLTGHFAGILQKRGHAHLQRLGLLPDGLRTGTCWQSVLNAVGCSAHDQAADIHIPAQLQRTAQAQRDAPCRPHASQRSHTHRTTQPGDTTCGRDGVALLRRIATSAKHQRHGVAGAVALLVKDKRNGCHAVLSALSP